MRIPSSRPKIVHAISSIIGYRTLSPYRESSKRDLSLTSLVYREKGEGMTNLVYG